MIDGAGVILEHNDKFKSDYPGIRNGDSIESIMWFEGTVKAHKKYLHQYSLTRCPEIIAQSRYVCANRRGIATPVRLGVFPTAGEKYVGLLIPISNHKLWLVTRGQVVVSASLAAIALLGKPPNGKAQESVFRSAEGWEELHVLALLRRGVVMAHCVAEQMALDDGAVCILLTDVTDVVRNTKLAIVELKGLIATPEPKQPILEQLVNSLHVMRAALQHQDIQTVQTVLEQVEEIVQLAAQQISCCDGSANHSDRSDQEEDATRTRTLVMNQLSRYGMTDPVVDPYLKLWTSRHRIGNTSLQAVIGNQLMNTISPETPGSVGNLLQGREPGAVEHELQAVLKSSLGVLGEYHPDTMVAYNNLGVVLQTQGHFQDAEQMYLQAANAGCAVMGPKHSLTRMFTRNLGLSLKAQVNGLIQEHL